MPKLTGGATTAEHKIATREAMLDAFIRELHEQGWQNVKLQTVAQAAGVSRTAVYNYFPTNLRYCLPGPPARWTDSCSWPSVNSRIARILSTESKSSSN